MFNRSHYFKALKNFRTKNTNEFQRAPSHDAVDYTLWCARSLDAFFYVEVSGRALVSMAAISGSMPRLTRGENMYRTIYSRVT